MKLSVERHLAVGVRRFSIQGQTVKIFSFAGHVTFMSVVTPQLCHHSAKPPQTM